MSVSGEIGERYRANMGRVRNIVALFSSQVAGSGPGRPAVRDTDLLRAAVVFMHATLEDVLRSVAEERLPAARPDVLKEVPLVGLGRKTSFTLGDLAAYQTSSVGDLIQKSVVANLERSNYNNVGEIKNLLDSIGLSKTLADPEASGLETMMKRRHLIAHRADQNDASGPGHHRTRSISRAIVERWIVSVDSFVTRFFAAL